MSFEHIESEAGLGPIKYCGIMTDRDLCKNKLSQMYKKNKPELITQNIDDKGDKNELSKNPFIKIDNQHGHCALISFFDNCMAIFNSLKNISPAILMPKKLRQFLQDQQKDNNPKKFYLRCKICGKQNNTYQFKYHGGFSYKNKNGLENGVGEVSSLSVCGAKVAANEFAKMSAIDFEEAYEIKLYIGTERGINFLIPDECVCFACVGVSKKKISFAIINSNGEIETVFHDFAKYVETKNLTVCKENKRSFEQFKSLSTPTEKEIDEWYQNFINERNPNHEFEENENKIK